MNDSDITAKQQELRKSYKSLMICGKALIAFGAWTALRVILTLLMGDFNIRAFVEANTQALDITEETTVDMVIIILFVIVLLVCLIAFLFNYIAGRGAYTEGKTRKKGIVYIIVTVTLLFGTGYSIISSFLPEKETETPAAETQENQDTLIYVGENGEFMKDSGSLLMDLTQLVLCADILYSVYKARKLNKELGEDAA